MNCWTYRAWSATPNFPLFGSPDLPYPSRSSAKARNPSAESAGPNRRQSIAFVGSPCSRMTGVAPGAPHTAADIIVPPAGTSIRSGS